jgi:hypothetical protein
MEFDLCVQQPSIDVFAFHLGLWDIRMSLLRLAPIVLTRQPWRDLQHACGGKDFSLCNS